MPVVKSLHKELAEVSYRHQGGTAWQGTTPYRVPRLELFLDGTFRLALELCFPLPSGSPFRDHLDPNAECRRRHTDLVRN